MAAIARTFKAEQVLFKEGDPSQSIFVIKKGTVSIRKVKGSGFVEISVIRSNEVIGELSFFDRLPRSATAVAIEDIEVLEIPFESMEKIYSTVPTYMKTIAASIAERLRKANDTIRSLQKDQSK